MKLNNFKKSMKIKSSLPWYFFIRFFLIPIYDFVWKNIINFHGRILYLKIYLKKRIKSKYDLNKIKNDKIIIKDDMFFKNLSEDISDQINEYNLIEKSEKRLNSGTFNKESSNKYKSGEYAYVDDLFDDIDIKLKEKIIKFAVSHEIYHSASKYFGVLPVLAKINIVHNIVNTKQARASMLWHKDDFGYKSLDLFLAISDIDINNGPFEYVKKKNHLGIFYKIRSNLENQEPGQRNKITEDNFQNYFNKDELDKFTGKSGSGILIDSFTSYHRGGNCKSKNRLVLRISYQTPDSYTLSKKDKSFFIKYISDKDFLKDENKIYSLSKRNTFNITKKLMAFYRIFHYQA